MVNDLLTNMATVLWVLIALAFLLAHWCDKLTAGRHGQTVFANGKLI